MKKKFFAVALATTMALSTALTAAADTKSEVTISGFAGDETGWEAVTGDFDVTYTFKNETTGTANHENFILEFCNDSSDLTKGVITFRADAFGWWAEAFKEGTEVFDTTGFEWTLPEGWTWDNFPSDMKDCDVTVNAQRAGNIINVKFTLKGYEFSGKLTLKDAVADNLFVHLTGENVKLSNIKFVDNKAGSSSGEGTGSGTGTGTGSGEGTGSGTGTGSGSGSNNNVPTGDVAPIAAFAAVAVVACAAVVVSRKKVTE